MIGIYKLYYDEVPHVYIGQSINIEKRFKTHLYNLNKGKHKNYKLQNAFNSYGEPKLAIECEATKEELMDKESYYIAKYDSVRNGFNILPAGCLFPVLNGESNPFSKYDDDTILEAFFYLLDNKNKSLKVISKELGIHYSTIKNLNNGNGHKWISEIYPEEYKELLLNKGKREINISKIDYPDLLNPEFDIIPVGKNLTKFCRENNLSPPSIRAIYAGTQEVHRGWRLA